MRLKFVNLINFSNLKNIFLLILIFATAISAQSNPDSLKAKLPGLKGEERVELLNRISSIYRDLSDFEEAEKYCQEALSIAVELNYKEGIIDSENNLSAINLLSGQLQQGIPLARQALSKAVAADYIYGIGTALRNVSIYHINTNEPTAALDTIKLAISYFEEINDTLGIAASLTTEGVAYTKLNKINESVESFENAADLYLSQGSTYQAAHSYLNLGSIYTTVMGDHEKGVLFSTKALQNFEKVGDEFKAAYAKLVLGINYEELGDLEKPIELYSQSLKIFEDSGNPLLIANAVNNLGEVYKKRKEYEKAVSFYNRSLEISIEISNKESIAVALNNLGECSYYLDRINEAKDYYEKSFKILEELNDKHKMSISLNNQAEVYLKLNNNKRAISFSERAKEKAGEVGARAEEIRAYKNLVDAYEKSGRYKSALTAYKNFTALKDSVDSKKNSEQTAKILAEYETAQKESEIDLLRANNELKEAEIDKQQTIAFFLITISFLLLVFVAIYYKRYVAHKATNKKLLESEKELKELNNTKDLFFSIVAHDLKGPFNSLLGITEMLSEDIDELSQNEISNLSREVNQNARNVYRLLENLLDWSSSQLGKYNFEPGSFDMNEVVTQNVNLYRKMSKDKEIKMQVRLGSNVDAYADKNMIDSVVRNLINNAIKFTRRGGEVTILTESENGKALLKIVDTGIGMSKEELEKVFELQGEIKRPGTEKEKGTGLGLVLARDFIEQNDGKIEVESDEKTGTTFTIHLPAKK